MHATSDLRFALHGSYSRFSANIGLDDEVGSQGSVVFQVWADGELVFNSGVITGNSMNRQAHVSVAGKQELRLIVLDGGDGNAYDHANWADARLMR